MSRPAPGTWLLVREAVYLFVGMGCEPHSLPGHLADTNGGQTWQIRYLFNPESEQFVSLGDLEPDERIGPDEIENWERRLGVKIPPPPSSDWWNRPKT